MKGLLTLVCRLIISLITGDNLFSLGVYKASNLLSKSC